MKFLHFYIFTMFFNISAFATTQLITPGSYNCAYENKKFIAYVNQIDGKRLNIHFTQIDKSKSDGCPTYSGSSCYATGVKRSYTIKKSYDFIIRDLTIGQQYYPMQSVSSSIDIFQKVTIEANNYFGKWKKIKSTSRNWSNLISFEVFDKQSFEVSFPSIISYSYQDPDCGCTMGTKFAWEAVSYAPDELKLAHCEKRFRALD